MATRVVVVVSCNLGLGKSSVSREFARLSGFELIVGDDIRHSKFKHVAAPEAWRLTWREIARRVRSSKRSVVVDYLGDDGDLAGRAQLAGVKAVGFWLQVSRRKLLSRRPKDAKRINEVCRSKHDDYRLVRCGGTPPRVLARRILARVARFRVV